jgi:hypothetical protein
VISQRPRYHMLKTHGKDPAVIAEKMRADHSVRVEAMNELEILENRINGRRIIDRCVTSKEYAQTLHRAMELADEPRDTPPT